MALGVTLLKLGNGNEHCDHPWRQDFGLRINDSIEYVFFNQMNNFGQKALDLALFNINASSVKF